MWSRTEQVELALPIESVWEVLSDPTRLPQWHHFFESVEVTGGSSPVEGRGRYRPRGWAGTLHECTSGRFRWSASYHRLALRQPQPAGGVHEFEWSLLATETGCRLTQRVRVKGPPSPMFARVAGRPSARSLPLDGVRLYRLAGGGLAPDALRVVMAGGTGFLGQHLAADLVCRGQEVVLLTRKPDPALPFEQVAWDARTVGEWAEVFRTGRPLAVVNLAGKLVDCPPTPDNVAALRNSRVAATRALVEATCTQAVRHWLQASTTAIWSDAGDRRLDESSPLPTGQAALPQMTGVAQPWERAAEGANTDHLVWLRTSIVLAQDCPAFDRLAGLARLGAGGTVGPGDQWFSWIHLADWLAIARSALGLGPVELRSGVVVAASPEPVTNAELMRLLRAELAPARFGVPTPSPLLRVGAVALRTDPALALTGRHVTSKVLTNFPYAFPRLGSALRDLLD
ncbi:NAD-dependent epimerase/dehydratase family protein [Naumannella sp. ID2617S]|nr:NAD-dependent epimerase/dehydratase family protein [Naumannella sp. ID2617S]